MRHGTSFVNPYAPAKAVQEFFAGNPKAVRAGAFFFLASAIPLGSMPPRLSANYDSWAFARQDHISPFLADSQRPDRSLPPLCARGCCQCQKRALR